MLPRIPKYQGGMYCQETNLGVQLKTTASRACLFKKPISRSIQTIITKITLQKGILPQIPVSYSAVQASAHKAAAAAAPTSSCLLVFLI